MSGEYKRWTKDLSRLARRQGWKVEKGRHLKFRGPRGQVVCCSLTPRNPFRVQKDIISDLRRAGLSV